MLDRFLDWLVGVPISTAPEQLLGTRCPTCNRYVPTAQELRVELRRSFGERAVLWLFALVGMWAVLVWYLAAGGEIY